MTYAEAKRRIRNARLLACVVWAVSFIAALVLFMRIINESPFELRPLRLLIAWIYDHVPLVSVVWYWVPEIDSQVHAAAALMVIAAPLAGYLVAGLIWRWARVRASRLRRIDEQIEDDMIRESLKSGDRRSLTEIRLSIEIPTPSLWELFHERYLSGFIVQMIGAIAAGAVLFWLGWI